MPEGILMARHGNRLRTIAPLFASHFLPSAKKRKQNVATFCCIAGYAGNRTKRARFVHAPERFAVLVAPHFCAAKIGWQKVGGLQALVVDRYWLAKE
jgi:hypothetical protein